MLDQNTAKSASNPDHIHVISGETCINTEITKLPNAKHGFDWSYGSLYSGVITNQHTDLSYLLKQLWKSHETTAKTDDIGFIGASFKSDLDGSPHRKKALLDQISLLFLDYDEGDTSAAFQSWLDHSFLPNTCAAFHSTFSDGTNDPETGEIKTRYRAIIPLSRPISLSDYERLISHLAPQVGEIDPSSKRATQLMLGPRSNPASTRSPWLHVREGELLDVDALLRQIPAPALHKPLSRPIPPKGRYRSSAHPTSIDQKNEDARRHYAEEAMIAELWKLRGAREGERNEELNKSAFALGQLVAAGYLYQSDVEAALASIAEGLGLSSSEARATIRSGLDAGVLQPRDLSHVWDAKILLHHQLPKELQESPLLATSRFMPPPEIREGVRLVIFRASLCSGKTYQIIRLLEPMKTFALTSPRVTLTRELERRVEEDGHEDVVHYQDATTQTIYDNKTVVCINSTNRIHLGDHGQEAVKRDATVIDEVEQCLPVLFNKKLRKSGESGELYQSLKTLLMNSGQVLAADAFCSEGSIEILKQMMELRDDEIQIIDHEYIEPDLRFVMADTQADLEKQTFAMLDDGKRLVIPCTAKSDVIALEKQIKARFPDLKVLAVHSESDEETRATIHNVNESWVKYDVVIYSPTISSGVSFEAEGHFDHIVLFARSVDGIGYNDLLQKLRRARYPKSMTMYVWIDGKTYRRSIELEQIRREALLKIETTHDFLTQHPTINIKTTEGKLMRHPANEEHFEAWAVQEREQRKRCNNVKGCFLAYCKTRGIPVEDLNKSPKTEAKELNEERRELKQEVKREKYEQIMEAEEISIEEARLIEQKHCATKDEKLAAKRARLKDFYGELTLELVSRSEGSEELPRKLRELNRLGLYLEGQEGEHYFAQLDQQEHETGFDLHMQHHSLKCFWLLQLLLLLEKIFPGLPLLKLLKAFSPLSQDEHDPFQELEGLTWTYEEEQIQTFQDGLWTLFENEEARTFLQELRGFGFTPERPKQLLSSLLRYLGLKKDKGQRRVEGKPKWFHWLNLDHLRELHQLGANNRDRLFSKIEELRAEKEEQERGRFWSPDVTPVTGSFLKRTPRGGVTAVEPYVPMECGISAKIDGGGVTAGVKTTERLNRKEGRNQGISERPKVVAKSPPESRPWRAVFGPLKEPLEAIMDKNPPSPLRGGGKSKVLEQLASSIAPERDQELLRLARFFVKEEQESREEGRLYRPRLEGIHEFYFPNLPMDWIGKLWWSLRPLLLGGGSG